jgi:hypothetical protein
MDRSYSAALRTGGQEEGSETASSSRSSFHPVVPDGPQPPAEWPAEMAEKFTKLLMARRTGSTPFSLPTREPARLAANSDVH